MVLPASLEDRLLTHTHTTPMLAIILRAVLCWGFTSLILRFYRRLANSLIIQNFADKLSAAFDLHADLTSSACRTYIQLWANFLILAHTCRQQTHSSGQTCMMYCNSSGIPISWSPFRLAVKTQQRCCSGCSRVLAKQMALHVCWPLLWLTHDQYPKLLSTFVHMEKTALVVLRRCWLLIK